MATTEEVRLTLTAGEFNRAVDQVEAKFRGAAARMDTSMQGIAGTTRMIGKLMGGLGVLALANQVMGMAERLAALAEQGVAAADARQLAGLGGSPAGQAAALFGEARAAGPPGTFDAAGGLLKTIAHNLGGAFASMIESPSARDWFRAADEAWTKTKEAANATSDMADNLRLAAEQRARFEAGLSQGVMTGLEREAEQLGGSAFVHETRRARAGMEDAAREAEYLRKAIADLREKLTKAATDFGPAPMILGPGQ